MDLSDLVDGEDERREFDAMPDEECDRICAAEERAMATEWLGSTVFDPRFKRFRLQNGNNVVIRRNERGITLCDLLSAIHELKAGRDVVQAHLLLRKRPAEYGDDTLCAAVRLTTRADRTALREMLAAALPGLFGPKKA